MNKLMMMAMVAAMAVAGPAWAATSIGYSGQLLDATGQKLPDGQRNVTVTFKLYGGPSDIVPLWQVERAVLLNADGYFSVELEDEENTLETVLGRSTLYLGLTPKGANEIQPRQKILPNPRAVVAERGVNDFKVEGTATITTVKAETVQAESVKQKYNGEYSDLLPKGAIIMWSGTTIPSGWALCDGNGNKMINDVKIPDLRGRFIVGAGGDYKIEDKGGAAAVTLTINQMPKHRHDYTIWQEGYDESFNHKDEVVGWQERNATKNRQTDYAGEGQAHENRPPYYALAFIIKVM